MRLLAFVLLNEIVVSLPRACRVPLPLSAAGRCRSPGAGLGLDWSGAAGKAFPGLLCAAG